MTDRAAPRNPDLFATYAPRQPTARRAAPLSFVVRASILADRDALADIAWKRNGGLLDDCVARFERDLTNIGRPPDDLWLTALIGARAVGYGKVAWIEPGRVAPSNHAPAGYYLGGVSVRPDFRRRGIGHELTRRRLLWIAERAAEAFYFVNAQNRASIDLHARFGFVELTRNFHIPGASFVGGVGILFRVDLTSYRGATEPSPQPSPGVPGEGGVR